MVKKDIALVRILKEYSADMRFALSLTRRVKRQVGGESEQWAHDQNPQSDRHHESLGRREDDTTVEDPA